MCDSIGDALNSMSPASRRTFLAGSGLAAVAGTFALGPVGAAQAATKGKPRGRTGLTLLGTAGGPSILSADRFGVSTAVTYGDDIYVIDLGHGAHMRFLEAGFGSDTFGGTTMARIRGIFFTHLHSDHIAEWPAVYATGSMNNVGRTADEPIKVFGPGPRPTLPSVFPPNRPAPAVVNPDEPGTGISSMSKHLDAAFSQDFNERSRGSNFTRPSDFFDVHDIDLSGIWSVDPDGLPPRLEKPIEVWTDGDVRITATLVDHHPLAPAFAYRFDTPDGSIVISGDTCVSENLIDLAQDCDYLVHEVIDPQFAEDLAAALPPAQQEPVKNHLLESHTTIEEVGRDVAEKAGAKNLVLTHLVPATTPKKTWKQAQTGYSGTLHVGEDLMAFSL